MAVLLFIYVHVRVCPRGFAVTMVPVCGMPDPLDLRTQAASHCVADGHHTQVLEPAPWLIIATVTSFYVLDTVSLHSSGWPQTPSAPVSAS